MRFLSVAERELRAAARHRATFRTRWITAAAFLGLLIWLFWAFDGFTSRGAVPRIFNIFAVLIFFYCLTIGTALTADCLSSEKREGTLGLLFLTNLNAAEIIAGKFLSRALAAVYGLIAILPVLAMLLLLGGITFEHFGKVVLALLNAIFFAIACGFVASALCVRQFTAIALGMGMALLFGSGLMAAAAIVKSFRGARLLVDGLNAFCPLYTLITAGDLRVPGGNHYWFSLAVVAGTSCVWIALVVWTVARTWRDRPKTSRATGRFKLWQHWKQRGQSGRMALRRRLLDINPFLWLGGRRRVSSPIFMLLLVVIVLITAKVTAPFFGGVIRAGTLSPLVGSLIAWLWTGLAIHALVLYYAAMVASQRLAEDKHTGALELILSTPTTERAISRGLWLAFGRRMFFPALSAVLVHFYFIWQGATLVVFEPPSPLPAGMTPGKLLWSVLFNQSALGQRGGWEISCMLQAVLLILALLIGAWFTLGWVARWLGLRMKHPGFAPMVSLGLLVIPIVMLFSLEIYLAGEFKLYRMPERHFVPLMMWIMFATSAGHCVLLSAWAARRLRQDFRSTVTSRFQPAERRRFLPRGRTVVRFTVGALGTAAAIALLVFSFYGYQNWRSRRAWAAFQQKLKQKGESLDVAAAFPAPVVDPENFVRTAAFQNLLIWKTPGAGALLEKLKSYDLQNNAYSSSRNGADWINQLFSPLGDYTGWIGTKKKSPGTNQADYAAVIVRGLQPHEEALRALAEAARLPHFQFSTNRTSRAALNPDRAPILALERLHLLLQWRACARLAVGFSTEAGEDLLTTFRLVQLAREIPDTESSTRVQILMMRSLQPLWEGLARHQWNESQLAEFQAQLTGFNFLADYTNTVRRVVRAHIEVWRAIPGTKTAHLSIPTSRGGYVDRGDWQLQPSAWWLDHCVQLHQAGENAIKKMDIAAGRVSLEMDWSELNGLPLDGESMQLLQQGSWWGANPALVAFAQTALNQAIIACALERFHLANGKFPEVLGQLTPAYLERIPHDFVSGRVMIYQRDSDHRYILRGVGQNQLDDRKSPSSDDWLWWYGTNAPPAVKAIKGN